MLKPKACLYLDSETCLVAYTTSFLSLFGTWCGRFAGDISFAQWHDHSQWSSTEAWWLLIENFSQYPARRLETQTAMQCLEIPCGIIVPKENSPWTQTRVLSVTLNTRWEKERKIIILQKFRLEHRGIDPRTSRMLSERSTIWARSPEVKVNDL